MCVDADGEVTYNRAIRGDWIDIQDEVNVHTGLCLRWINIDSEAQLSIND